MPPVARFPSVGEMFGAYRITGQLGRGGMGVVFAAEQVGLGRTVALKVLSPELAEQDDYRRRFAREASVLARVDSPHIISIFDHGEHDGCLYIATQYVAGGDLSAALRAHGPVPSAPATEVAAQLALALSDAHQAGVDPPRPQAQQRAAAQHLLRRLRLPVRLRHRPGPLPRTDRPRRRGGHVRLPRPRAHPGRARHARRRPLRPRLRALDGPDRQHPLRRHRRRDRDRPRQRARAAAAGELLGRRRGQHRAAHRDGQGPRRALRLGRRDACRPAGGLASGRRDPAPAAGRPPAGPDRRTP